MTKPTAHIAANIFTGQQLLQNQAIITANGMIEKVIHAKDIDKDAFDVYDYGNATLTPAFIDIQLYGANNRLLAVMPDSKTVEEIYRYSLQGGAAWCMPTVATHPYEIIFACIDAVKNYWLQDGKGVLGLHVEGPWISKAKRGAHKEDWIVKPSDEEVKKMLEYGKGIIKIITLAPEECDDEIVSLIQSYGVVVSAGHSNATYAVATKAFDKGIGAATHLFNAMSALQHREPGMVGAIFNHHNVMCSLVPDGFHVDFAAIKIARKVMGERLFAITDAVTETNAGWYKHTLEGDKYTSNGILSGSALTMHKAFKNLMQHCDIPFEESIRMCSLYPAKALALDDKLGMIKENYQASMLVLDKEMNIVKVMEN